jgi:hypothetical protein
LPSPKPSNGYANERAFKKAILRRLRAAGFFCWSNGAGAFAKAGRPDIEGVVGDCGVHFAIEAKQPGGAVTVLQARELGRLARNGAYVCAPLDMATVENFIKKLQKIQTVMDGDALLDSCVVAPHRETTETRS